ncbi:MAG: hypothetical protein P8Z49_04560 [Acidobacteriota bacterium]
MKRIVALLLLLTPLALLAGAKPYLAGSLQQAEAAAKAQNKMLILKFYADW